LARGRDYVPVGPSWVSLTNGQCPEPAGNKIIVEYRLEQVASQIYVLASWDASWNSYNNCYILLHNDQVTLIDSGKAEHVSQLVDALSRLGKTTSQVNTLIATHNHMDHVGGSVVFPTKSKLIHKNDWNLLDDKMKSVFQPTLPDNGKVLGLDCLLLGHHTSGSVALFEPRTRALFCGDHICFFGDPLPSDGFVSYGPELRKISQTFVLDWARDVQQRKERRLDLFAEGMVNLQRFDAEVLCTGHGAVLKGEIADFCSKLYDAAQTTN